LIDIRELQQGDAENVMALDQEIRGPDRSSTWDQYVGRVLDIIALDSLEYAPWGCFVAVDRDRGGEIIAFLMSERQTASYGLPPGVRIVAMAVHPDYRRQGIGSRLVDMLTEKAKAEGVCNMFSVLLDEDERDASFLERNGFSGAHFKVFRKEI
jgi:GNAT superfamily N-acetyltransferase